MRGLNNQLRPSSVQLATFFCRASCEKHVSASDVNLCGGVYEGGSWKWDVWVDLSSTNANALRTQTKTKNNFVSLQAYTYGLCGPLALSPSAAVVIDSSYNGGFMAGRIVSVLLAKFIRPRNMIIASVAACITAAVALCAFGPVDKHMLYVGTGERNTIRLFSFAV